MSLSVEEFIKTLLLYRELAQLVERHPYKVDVAGSNPVLPTILSFKYLTNYIRPGIASFLNQQNIFFKKRPQSVLPPSITSTVPVANLIEVAQASIVEATSFA